MKKAAFWTVIALMIGLPSYLLIRQHLTTETERIRGIIDDMVDHMEAEGGMTTVPRIFQHVAPGYRHRDSHVGRREAMLAVAGLRRSHEQFDVDIQTMDITVIADAATVEMTGRITATRKGGPGERVAVLIPNGWNRVTLHFEKQDGDWMVTSSEASRLDLNEPD
jgi:hypothetical protein